MKTINFDFEKNNFEKVAIRDNSIKKYYASIKSNEKLCSSRIGEAIVKLIEKLCTEQKNELLDNLGALARLSIALVEYKNEQKLEVLKKVLDKYVEKEEIPTSKQERLFTGLDTKYVISSIDKIPQDIQNNIIEASNRKSKAENKLEKETKKL